MASLSAEVAEIRELLIGQARMETDLKEILRRLDKLENVENKMKDDQAIHRKELDAKIAELQRWIYMMMGAGGIISFLSPVIFKKLGL